jgi:hypothetical protein
MWKSIITELNRVEHPNDFILPVEGRAVLLRVEPDGEEGSIWNDWVGSIPIFFAKIDQGFILSTLEPAVVEGAELSEDNFDLPSIVSLLVNSHFIYTDTLYRSMSTLPPDSVTIWKGGDIESQYLGTVKPSNQRWACGWDELAEECHSLLRTSIIEALSDRESWVLPLSAGMDSRLVAAVNQQMDSTVQTCTYGPATWMEPLYARQVANRLGLPWHRVDFGTDYLARYTELMADMFGSSSYYFLQYCVPLLKWLEQSGKAGLIVGYMGDSLAGNHLPKMRRVIGMARGETHWKHSPWRYDQLRSVLQEEHWWAIDEARKRLLSHLESLPGADYQRMMLLDFWNRQRLFISAQPTLYSYWTDVAAPYMNREYARFWLSVPLLALEERRLVKEVMKRFYPEVAKIAGSFANPPLILSQRWLMRAGLASVLPKALRRGPLREFNPTPNTFEPDCVRATGIKALWPLPQAEGQLQQWFQPEYIKNMIKRSLEVEFKVISELEAFQPIAYALLRSKGVKPHG